jgi:hypothetical protein
MTMVLGVPIAFLGTRGARTNAGLEQRAHHEVVPLARPRKNPRRGVTEIDAGLTERDAGSQRSDVVLEEICVRARGAGLDAVEAGIDRRRDLLDPEWDERRRRVQHLPSVTHARKFPRRARWVKNARRSIDLPVLSPLGKPHRGRLRARRLIEPVLIRGIDRAITAAC